MPSFPGWRRTWPGQPEFGVLESPRPGDLERLKKQKVTGQLTHGLELIVKANNKADVQVLQPTLKTLVEVERIVRDLQIQSRTQRSAQQRLSRLSEIAPKTFEAIREMPRIHDSILSALGIRPSRSGKLIQVEEEAMVAA